MIAKAIKEEHPRPRPVHLTVEHFFKGYPRFSMLVPKIGGVPAHPANVQRLLYDEGQLVLVFPEGRKGTEKLYKDRYQLRRFGRGGFVEAAMRAQAPIVPIAVVGAEESMPMFAQLRALQKLTGLLYFPITRRSRTSGCSASLGYLPAKFKIRFLEPIPTDQWGPEPYNDRNLVQSRGGRRPRTHPGRALRHARQTQLGVVRMRVLVTGVSSFWGGKLAQALERDPAVEVIVGVSPEDPTLELERTEYVRVGTQHALLRRIVQAAEIDTVVDSRLIVDSATASARDAHESQRHRDDEHPRRLLGPGLAGAQVRLQVDRALLRLRAGRPRLLHRAHAAPAPAAHRAGARHRRGREGGQLVRRAQHRRHRHHAALRQRARP